MREPGTEILNVPSPEQMQVLGRAIGGALDAIDDPFIIALEGELGAGKTTLVGGILRAYGITGPVRSPTYTLIEPYETERRPIYHLDLYRLVDPEEVEPLGIRDLLTGRQRAPGSAAGGIPREIGRQRAPESAGRAGASLRSRHSGILPSTEGIPREIGPALLLIEWPSKAAEAIPAADLWIDISYPATGTDGRHLALTPLSPSGLNVVRRIVAAIPELRQLSS